MEARRKENVMSKVRHPTTLSGPGRKGSYLFVALILVVVAGAVIGVEALRRFSSRPAAEKPNAHSAADAGGAGFPRQVRDGGGQPVTIEARPKRIVSQTLGTDEILLAICSPERIVGLGRFALDPKYSNVVEQARAAGSPVVHNTEEILRLKPDLVFVASYSRAEVVEQLQSAGARVFRLADFNSIENIKRHIRVIGQATGDDERAEALIAQMERELEAVRAHVPAGNKRPRVMSYSPSGSTAGANTLFDDILHTLGATNVVAENGVEGFRKVSAEQVVEWQPDFIVLGADADKFEETRQQLLANPAVATTEAARAGRVIMVENRSLLTVSHNVVNLVKTLAGRLYPNSPDRSK
jgi:iron complex transport system substrate-binding protein